VTTALSITSAVPDPALLDLPWNLPLELWPEEYIAALPKGISRHLVRFVRLGEHVLAVKETTEEMATREYELLRTLNRLDLPCVEPVAVITNRSAADGEVLAPVLVTRHLRFSLPYRAVFSQSLRPDTATRLVDALAVLLARLHLSGFFWGDVSLSNTLFRRDAGAFAAYLVDAETGTLHDRSLSDGQREHDLEIGRVNIAGELLDLQSGGKLDEDVDPVELADRIARSYRELWTELTASESFPESERWRIARRVERLNDLGFDIEELAISRDEDGAKVRIQPKVVDAGHHSRRLLRLTGLDAGENQARRLLNDLDAYRSQAGRPNEDEEVIAHEWLAKVFEPVVRAIPRDLRGKLEPAEMFHQLLEHRWYRSQDEKRNVPLAEALTSYIETVLRHRRDEVTVTGPPTGSFNAITQPIGVIEDWRDKV
jgi:Lipopolysaccharide kinase (Kdo/WaaP) family.